MHHATLRLWADHPFSARFLKDVRAGLAQSNKIERILSGLELDGWLVEHEEADELEICWVATKTFDAFDEAVAECRKRNPNQWGSLLVEGEDVW